MPYIQPESAVSGAKINGTTLSKASEEVADLSRFFEMVQSLSKSLYIGSFRNAINIGADENYFDIQIGQAFIRAWGEFKSGNVKIKNDVAHQVEQEIGRIFRFGEFQVNPSADGQTLHLIIDGKSYRLAEIGSGISQFILVLVNAAIQQPSLILIDEPELSLHASLQLDFLTTLSSYAKEGTLFATHNVGLARAGADWVYSVSKYDDGSEIHPYEGTPRLSQFLGELSFSGHSELGFDKVLLVEGVTDIKTIQQFLRLYRKEHQVLVLPLGGSQLINAKRESELQETRRISDNVSVLIDSERPSEDAPLSSDREGFVKMCNDLGFHCHVLKFRATENYFTTAAIQQFKSPKYQALEPHQLLKEVQFGWAKEENWRIAREMTIKDLEGTDLGEFLKAL